MKIKIKIAILLVISVGFAECKKAGLGGDATLIIFPKHHSKPIFGATVYLKLNSKDSPTSPTTNYDALFKGEATEDKVTIKNLKKGSYYLYALGFDSSIATAVYGGRSYTIYNRDKKEELPVVISVTE